MVSFCAVRLELEESGQQVDIGFNCNRSLDDLLSTLKLSEAAKPARLTEAIRTRARGKRLMSSITVETFTAKMMSQGTKECSPTLSVASGYSKRSTKDSTPDANLPNEMNFFSGNPFVEVTKGILHLYKENQTTSLEDGVIRSQMICMLGVPAKLKTPDLLSFTAPVHSELEMIRVIHDGNQNQFMVLLRFRCQAAADEFYQAFNGMPYNSLEPDFCSLVYVSKVESCKESQYYLLSNHTELPVCSICLERMDESVSTVLTILCNHTFHSSCLAQWEDATCPVCRYIQTPEQVAEQRCSECQSAEDLWICLICGYVGCGRYVGGHSHAHFLETEHSYTMELGQHRVWDYVGDNFVHRLVQTDSADGKLVEAEGPSAYCKDSKGCSGHSSLVDGVAVNSEEKMDSIQLEYTYLLASQLESQRRYYEDKISRIESGSQREMEELASRARAASVECQDMESRLGSVLKEKAKTESKVGQMNAKLSKVVQDLAEERQLNECLRQNQASWQTRIQELERQLKDKDEAIVNLQEQLRDVMFYLEAQQKIAQSPLCDEIKDGDLVVTCADTPSASTPSRLRSAATPGSAGSAPSKKKKGGRS